MSDSSARAAPQETRGRRDRVIEGKGAKGEWTKLGKREKEKRAPVMDRPISAARWSTRETERERGGTKEGENLLHLWHGEPRTRGVEERGHGRVGLLLIEEHEVALCGLARETLPPPLLSFFVVRHGPNYCITRLNLP